VDYIVNIHIHGDFDIDIPIEWAEENCRSFLKYVLVELGWEERLERHCWFRLDVYFTDEADAMLFTLRWV
jgi:hypothetical protein